MTAEEATEYGAKVDAIIATLSNRDTATQVYPNARELVEQLIPGRPENIRVLNTLRCQPLPHLTVTEYRQALAKWERQWEALLRREAQAEAKRDAMETAMLMEIGGIATDERTFVDLFMAKRGYDMRYDRSFTAPQGPMVLTDISNDMHLTASTLKLTRPRGSLLSSSNLDRALDEWQIERREARRDVVIAQINRLPPEVTREQVMAAWHAAAAAYFADEPGFAAAAVCKHIWQVKRKLLGLPIANAHVLVICGAQNTGKSWLGRELQRPIEELAIEANLLDLLDTRQMDMVQNYSVFCDELAFADRAEAAALKTLVTGAVTARRPMRSNRAENVPVNCVLHGNTNRSLGSLIFDSSGMRRFIEVRAKARQEIEPHWHLIADFNWSQLWQAVDPQAVDPMLPFADQLNAVQEEIRNPDNVELWLREFEFNRNTMPCKIETTDDKKVEFWAADLYDQFRIWESQYDPGYRGTSLNRWGREMKSLIDQNGVPNWYRRQVGNKSVYGMRRNTRMEVGSVVPWRS